MAAGTVQAQSFQVSGYGGWQTAPHSNVSVTDGTEFRTAWEGRSFDMPPYYGVRGTWWLDDLGLPSAGLSIDFSHAKVYSAPDDRPPGWQHFEFTDGLNLLTANAFYRFGEGEALRSYVGLGAGITVPHVEVNRSEGYTHGYQYGGPTVQWTLGAEYMFIENWSVFAEYKGNHSWVDVEIDNDERLTTNIYTNALNVGVSFHF